MRVWLEDQEITGLCIQTVIDKDIDGAGAQGEVTLVCAPMDSRLPRLHPACGQWVVIREAEKAGEELFSGRVERVSYDAGALALTLLCFDPASLLAKNQCRGPYQGTPQEIAAQLCRECGLQPGEIWPGDGQPVKLAAVCGRTAFRAIQSLYERPCMVEYQAGRVIVEPRGNSRAVIGGGRLIGLTSRNSMEQVFTRVQVYGGGKMMAQADDFAGQNQYGLRQKTEYLSRIYPDAESQAQAGLAGASRQARLALTGRSPVRCGQLVTLDKPLMGVYGAYMVTQVTWRCRDGQTTTELGVEGW